MQRYIIAYSVVAIIIGGFLLTMHKAAQFDYRFVNRCSAAGGEAQNIGDTWRCSKDGKQLLVGE